MSDIFSFACSNQGLDDDVEPLKLAPVVGAVVLYCTSVFRPQMLVVILPKVIFLHRSMTEHGSRRPVPWLVRTLVEISAPVESRYRRR